MALASTLSAFKQLVLDGVEIPESQAERLALYRGLFPALSTDEAEDLAASTPAQLAKYTNSIFTAQGEILSRNFPLSISLVKRHWPQCAEPFSLFRLAQVVHSHAPWRGIHSDSLGESFIAFLSGRFLSPGCMEAGAVDLARFELAALRIRKAPNGTKRPMSTVDFDGYTASLTVAALLNEAVSPPGHIEVLTVSHDVLGFQRLFCSKQDPFSCPPLCAVLVGARPVGYGAQWVAVPQAVADLLRSFTSPNNRSGVPVHQVAEAYSDLFIGRSEQDAFVLFTAQLRRLVEIGALAFEH